MTFYAEVLGGSDVSPCTGMSEHAEQPIVTPYFLKSALVTKRRRGVTGRWMDDLRSWRLDSLSSFRPRFGYIPRKTSKSIPIVDIPSTLFVHPSKPCSFHDSFSGHDQGAASSRVVSKKPSNIQLWLHSTCNWSCYRWAVVDGFLHFCNKLLPSTSRTSHFSRQAIFFQS